MLALYWGCLIGGAMFTLVTIVFGDVLDAAVDGMLDFLSLDSAQFLHPLTLVGGVTIFGGAGILMTEYTAWTAWIILICSACLAFLLSAAMYFSYVKPMKHAENSTAYSVKELVGTIVEVSLPIPAGGYGEIIVRTGAGGVSNQIAAGWGDAKIDRDQRAVVVDVRDGVLYVSPFDEEN